MPTVNSDVDPDVNADGSVGVYFGREPPTGKEENQVKTIPGQGWFAYIRLYGPTKSFFDKTWKPDDIELMKRSRARVHETGVIRLGATKGNLALGC